MCWAGLKFRSFLATYFVTHQTHMPKHVAAIMTPANAPPNAASEAIIKPSPTLARHEPTASKPQEAPLAGTAATYLYSPVIYAKRPQANEPVTLAEYQPPIEPVTHIPIYNCLPVKFVSYAHFRISNLGCATLFYEIIDALIFVANVPDPIFFEQFIAVRPVVTLPALSL